MFCFNLLLISVLVCVCNTSFEPYIIGGRPVSPHNKWPWAAVLTYTRSRRPLCSGAILSPDHVITTATCVNNRLPNTLQVVVGSHDIAKGQRLDVKEYIKHLHYFVNTNGYPVNDIAIVRLKQPVDYSSHIRPIQIPDSYPSGTCYFAGWGPTQNRSSVTGILHDIRASPASTTACNTAYPGVNIIAHLCTTGANPCGTDRGSPLMCLKDNNWYLYGLASFGECTGSTYVSSKVWPWKLWIQDNIAPTPGCSNVTSTIDSRTGGKSSDTVWCDFRNTGTILLSEGPSGRSHNCSYAWGTDDGEYFMEIQCDGHETRHNQAYSLASAKAHTLCKAKHSLMSRGPNKPTQDTIAVCDGNSTAGDPYVTIRCR